MKTRLSLYILLCIMLPCFALADNIKTYNFPIEDGVTIYGATMKDDLGPLHYVKFHSNNGKVEKIARIDENDNGTRMLNLRCGAFCGDKFYGYLVNIYTYVEEPKAFGTVDFNTGTFTTIRDGFDKDERVSWPTMYEMTYDYSRKTCWALGRNADGEAVSDLYKINLADGTYQLAANLDFYAWAMACDYEGNLYMIKGIPDKKNEFYAASSLVRLDTDNNFSIADEKRIKINNADFIPNYTHSMEFDHNSNTLYWLGMNNDGWQNLYRLDVNTGEAVKTAEMSYNMISSMYIPFKGADCREAAGKVTDISGRPAADGSLKASLSWINPTTNWRGDKLEALKSITVAKDNSNNIIATLDAEDGMGNKMMYDDNNANKGYNIYYITSHRRTGENGLTDSVRVFVGADTPGTPRNISLTRDGGNVVIEWQAPETGRHGENFDISSTVYEITRKPDNIVIASNLSDTSFTDDQIGEKKMYSYVIKASNKDGEGLSATSYEILIGKAHELPFEEDFSSEGCKGTWTSVDNNGDGNMFEWAGGGSNDFCRYQAWLSNQSDMDDYLITPPLATKKNNLYRVSYDVQLGRMEDIHSFEVTIGSAATAEAQTITIDTHDKIICESYGQVMSYEATFSADADETYLGFHCKTYKSETGSYFAIRNVRIEPVYEKDLAVLGISGNRDIVCSTENILNVSVKNNGSEPQHKFKVEVVSKDADSTMKVLGYTDVSETLGVNDVVEIPVTIIADSEGKIELAARVILEGDMNNANDMCEWDIYNVNPAGTSEWNIVCNGDNPGVSTTEPMNFYRKYSTVESIYLRDEIKAEKDGNITRIAYQYSDNGLSAETKACEVKIYLANTDRSEYDAEPYASDWTPLDKSQLACVTNVTVKPGKDNLMIFELDKPFRYDHTKNLSVQVWKEGALDEMFPALFNTYNAQDKTFRSLRYDTNTVPFEFDDYQKFFPINAVPVIHIAMEFDNNSRIDDVTCSSRLAFNSERKTLMLEDGTISEVHVTDLSGRAVFNSVVNSSSVQLPLDSGIYIIKVIDKDGYNHLTKVVVK